MISKVITPGSPEDRMPFGKLCELLAQKIITANPNHQRHRIDLYREVRIHGRAYYVRVKVTVPFLTVVPPPDPAGVRIFPHEPAGTLTSPHGLMPSR